MGPIKSCQQCGNEFEDKKHPWRSQKFCSPKCYHASTKVPLAERLWNKVEKSEGCWVFYGARTKLGYGRMAIYPGTRCSPRIYTHRLSWILTNGPIPEGLQVRHKCDNPPCVRPDHLELGTGGDNIRDARDRNRMRHGVRHHNARLDPDKVRAIRNEVKTASQMAVSKKYGVRSATIGKIARRELWRHVT